MKTILKGALIGGTAIAAVAGIAIGLTAPARADAAAARTELGYSLALLKAGNFNAARAHAQAAIKEDPQWGVAHAVLARTFLALGDGVGAESELGRAAAAGFAPGFVYCGFHADRLRLPRRTGVRPPVAPGSVLFAAGQTAIAATSVPTGWHVIGRTAFRNFDPDTMPPTRLSEGDLVRFEVSAR